jgi:hypothetical protein
MIARRDLLLGGFATLSGGMMGCTCALASDPTGCVISSDQAARFLARDHPPGRSWRDDRIIRTSSDRAFDYALARTLSGLTDVFGVLPGFAYYDDGAAGNAYATEARRLGNPDGTVLFGRRFLDSVLAQGEHADVAVAAICAHEFGHIAQFKYNLLGPLLTGTRTIKRAELHADFLAGYYAGVRKRQKPGYPADAFAAGLSDLKPAMTAVRRHGNAGERAAAIARGFEVAHRDRRSFADAMRIGIDYVGGRKS